MQNVMDMKRNKPDIISFIKQAGVSSLLFIVLVGLSLTVLTVGYMSTMRNLQSSATTTHAQTQAQMQAMIGYHAFSKYLNQLSKEDNGLRLIDQLCNGELKESNPETQIKFERVGDCNNPVLKDQYNFDIIGKSGGASAILRVNYNIENNIKVIQQNGLIFAGGFEVNKLENNVLKDNIVASDISIEVPNSESVFQALKEWAQTNKITFKEYDPRKFVTPSEVKDHSNYIYTIVNNNSSCVVRNLFDNSKANCSNFTFTLKDKTWTIDGAPPIGIYWFDGNVKIKMKKDKAFVATIIATGVIETEVEDDKEGTYSAYSPHTYYLDNNSRLSEICPDNYPLQYCKGKAELKADMSQMPAAISNILFLADRLSLAGIKRNSADKKKEGEINYHGTMIAKTSDDGGSNDGKRWNSNVVVNITGNFIMTEKKIDFTGNSKVVFHKGKDQANFIPINQKVFATGGIRYM